MCVCLYALADLAAGVFFGGANIFKFVSFHATPRHIVIILRNREGGGRGAVRKLLIEIQWDRRNKSVFWGRNLWILGKIMFVQKLWFFGLKNDDFNTFLRKKITSEDNCSRYRSFRGGGRCSENFRNLMNPNDLKSLLTKSNELKILITIGVFFIWN